VVATTTLCVTFAVLTHPLASVALTVYTVFTVGDTAAVGLGMLPGWIVYVVAFPPETSMTVWPAQIVLLSDAMFTIGKGFAVTVSML
jgi:hypothetical protein